MSLRRYVRQPPRVVPLRPILDRMLELEAVGLSVRTKCWVRDFATGTGSRQPIEFVVDSGCSFTTIPFTVANRLNIPVPDSEQELELSTLTAVGVRKVRVRPGVLHIWWNDRFEGDPFDWTVLFLNNLQDGSDPPALLGLGSLLGSCRWSFSGESSESFPFGYLKLRDIRPTDRLSQSRTS